VTDVARRPPTLNPLGLSPGAEAAYELLVQQPFATQPELAAAWARREDTCGQDISAVLADLEHRGLVDVLAGPPIRYSPAAPGIAFRALLLDHERRLAEARQYRASLDEAYRARAAGPRTPRLVEVVTGERAVRQRFDEILDRARREICCLSGAPNQDNRAADAVLADQDLICRTIYGQVFLSQPGALSAVAELIQCGLQARVLPDLTLQLYIVDSTVALLCEHGSVAVESATIVHPSALFDALVKLFEAMWQSAVPLRPPGGRPASSRRTPAHDQEMLITLLLSGLTDAAIGRQVGRSQRSIQRHVAALMADLGAHTRFQAGAQAARR
jgi:DNA-binding NarL/FixJ family response regulator